MPVIMFDKDGQYVVKLLEEVSCSLDRFDDCFDRLLAVVADEFWSRGSEGGQNSLMASVELGNTHETRCTCAQGV